MKWLKQTYYYQKQWINKPITIRNDFLNEAITIKKRLYKPIT